MLICSQAARQGHQEVVEILVLAGARLGGMDEHFANTMATNAMQSDDQAALAAWVKAGLRAT